MMRKRIFLFLSDNSDGLKGDAQFKATMEEMFKQAFKDR